MRAAKEASIARLLFLKLLAAMSTSARARARAVEALAKVALSNVAGESMMERAGKRKLSRKLESVMTAVEVQRRRESLDWENDEKAVAKDFKSVARRVVEERVEWRI